MDPVIFVVGGGAGEEGLEGTVERQGQEVGVFPLLSWYHASWDSEPDLPKGVPWYAMIC